MSIHLDLLWRPASLAQRRVTYGTVLFACATYTPITYNCLHAVAPSFLADELEYAADFETRRRLRSASSSLPLNVRRIHGTRLSCPPSVIGPSLLLLPILGTVCPSVSRLHPLWLFSEVASRLSSSGVPSHEFYRNLCSAIFVLFTYFFKRLVHGLYAGTRLVWRSPVLSSP